MPTFSIGQLAKRAGVAEACTILDALNEEDAP